MPESFSSILDAIADEGRERMRPFPAEAVHALGRARQKRCNATVAATAVFVSCAVAVGLVFGTSSSHGAGPVTPPTSTPSAKNTAQASYGFLAPADVPNDAALAWRRQQVRTLPPNGRNGPPFLGDVCGSKYGFMGSASHSRATSAQSVSYEAATSKIASADEGIYTYPSDSAAADDLRDLTPDPAACGPYPAAGGYSSVRGHLSAQIGDGFGWTQVLNFDASGDSSHPTTITEHVLVVQRGRLLAFFIYRDQGGGPSYPASGDSETLQKLADRFAATQPSTTAPTSPPDSQEPPSSPSTPPTTDSATTPPVTSPPGDWLAVTELPFATEFTWDSLAGYSGPNPGAADSPRFGCQTKLPVGVSAPLWVSMKQWNANPNGGFATRVAVERQYVFASEDQAAKVIAGAKEAARATCHQFPGNYVVTTYGAVVSTADSVSYDETVIRVGVPENAQPSHQHEYLVRKGAVVVELELQTNSSVIDDTSGDTAVRAAMFSHLP